MENEILYISGIVYESLVNGHGLRTTIFFSDCNRIYKNFHNKNFHKKEKVKILTISNLVELIEKKHHIKK